MGPLDGLVTELANRFNLGDRAGPLAAAMLGVVTDSHTGGLAGFVDRLRNGGLGEHVTSWIGTGPNAPVAPEQVEQALGQDAVAQVSTSAGVSPATGRTALAFLIPKVIDMLTPDGTVPAGLPAGLGAYLGGLSGVIGGASTGIRHTVRGAGTGVGAAAASGSAGLRKLVPVVLVLLLVFLGYRMLGRRTHGIEPAGTDTTAMAPAEPAGGPSYDAAPDSTAPDVLPAGTAADAVAEAMTKASAALAGLQPGYGAGELVEALNLNIINFASGKADIPAESRDLLDQSAKAIEGAPAGTVLEVGGHTDNSGSAAANQALSQRRAAAVRDYLVRQGVKPAALTAKGYGPGTPVADNATDEGRFKNRRIEFSVVK